MKFQNFNNHLVYIMGGSMGIGLETGKIFAQKGANVVICARNEQKLQTALAEIKTLSANSSQRFGYKTLDVSNATQVKTRIEEMVKEFGIPDIFINCAGRAYPHYFEDITPEQFEETMKTNMFGIWYTVAAIVPYMKQKGGLIVNTSSMAGLIGVFGYTDYSASKYAIIGFSEALRQELKQYNIGVAVLCPPDTDTPGFQTENQTKPIETIEISKGAKLLKPEQVAEGLIKGIAKGKHLIIPSFDGRLSCFLKRVFPGVVDSIIFGAIKKAQDRKKTQ
jgi:short-subunit dehydrogenase